MPGNIKEIDMKRKWKIMIAVIIGVVVLGAVLAGPIMSDVEHPKYQIISAYESENIEIRKYNPMLIAEVSVSGKRDEAISDGFKQLADYIFGNNISEQSISMTAPVMQKSQKIAMTAPVMQKPNNGNWTVHFVMPSEYSMTNIPKPNNKDVILKNIPEKTMIAITFSGQNTDDNLSEYTQKLRDFMKRKNIKTVSDPSYAFYNPPWTLPTLRRNEVIFEIKDFNVLQLAHPSWWCSVLIVYRTSYANLL